MKKISNSFFAVAFLYLAVCLAVFPDRALATGQSALEVCLRSVIPALFPYLVCSGYLSASGIMTAFSRYLSPIMRPVFNVPGCGAASLVLGSVSGYPVGAVVARDLFLSGQCTKNEAERLLAFCNNSGPLFIVSVVGIGFLGSAATGQTLYISHLFSAVLTGIILRTFSKKESARTKSLPPPTEKIKNTPALLGGVIDSAVITMLKICGFVIFFTVFSASIPKSTVTPYIHSIFEITGGIKELSSLKLDYSLKLSLISFFLAFSGISVVLQVGAVVASSGLSLKPFFFGKILQGGLSFAITKILAEKFPQTVDVSTKNAVAESFKIPHSVFTSSLFMLIFGLLLLFLVFFLVRFLCLALRHHKA